MSSALSSFLRPFESDRLLLFDLDLDAVPVLGKISTAAFKFLSPIPISVLPDGFDVIPVEEFSLCVHEAYDAE